MAKGALQKTKSKANITKPSRAKKTTSKSDTESNEDIEESAEETNEESDNETKRSKRKGRLTILPRKTDQKTLKVIKRSTN